MSNFLYCHICKIYDKFTALFIKTQFVKSGYSGYPDKTRRSFGNPDQSIPGIKDDGEDLNQQLFFTTKYTR
jgi:hypothetical protein